MFVLIICSNLQTIGTISEHRYECNTSSDRQFNSLSDDMSKSSVDEINYA